ncbi:MAG: two-component regulator propeller domain-containing protein, partial [Bacteroidota bacterium]|nr:two-component regulator propeller domain-containing protein [Bacteroidota bacterium]
MIRYTLFTCFVLLYNLLFSQVVVDNYTTLNTGSNGLLESHIYSFAYGPDGKVWIATADGFSLYDGNNWSWMSYEEFYPGLDNLITLFADSNNNLWINRWHTQGDNILLRYDGNNVYSYGPADGYYGQPYESNLYEDISGNIYIQNPSSLIKFQNGSFSNISIPSGMLTGYNLVRDAFGKLIISSDNHTYRENSEGGWYEMHHVPFTQIIATSDSLTWLVADKYFRVYKEDSLLEVFELNWLPSTFITSTSLRYINILEENSGNIWLHSYKNKGILKFNGLNYTYYNSDSSGFYSNIFVDELILNDGRLWFASWTAGIEEWDGNQFNHINTFDGLVQNKINSIHIIADTIYFGTQNGCSVLKDSLWQTVLYGYDENGGKGSHINDIFYLGYNNFYFATGNFGIIYSNVLLNANSSKDFIIPKSSRNPVSHGRKTLEGFNNDYWFAHNNGFAHFFGDITQWGVITYWENFTTADGLPNDTVYDLCKDSIGNIWLATGNGVASFQNNTFTVYETVQGLVDNQTRSIYFDSNQNIWVGTIAGLSKYDGNSWLNYTQQNGLAGNMVNDIFEDSQGNMWFGTEQGLSKFSNQNFTNYSTAD